MKLDILHALNAEREARRAVVLVTDVASGAQRLVKAADVAKDPLRELIEKRLRMAKSGMEETPQGRFFLTVYVPSPKLVITGAVHISQALAPMGQLLGFDVTIVDPRTAFASIERFPDVKVIAEWPDVALPPLNVDRYTAFVALTHDPKIDDPALAARAGARLFLHRRARLAEDACQASCALKEGGPDRPRSRAHPCAHRAADRRGVAGRNRARHHGRDHADAAAEGREGSGGGMKFGAVPVKEALGATAVHSIRQGDLVLKKGTLIGDKEIAALQAAGVKEIVVARVEAGDVSEDQAAADIAAAIAGPRPARRPRLHRTLQSVRRQRRRAGGRQGRHRQAQPHRRGGDARHAAGLQAGGRRRDDRDGEDHPLRGGEERARSGGDAGRPSQAGHSRRALQGAQDRHRVDAAAGPRSKGGRKNAQDHRRAHCAFRRDNRCRESACRTSRPRSPKPSTRCSKPAPSW